MPRPKATALRLAAMAMLALVPGLAFAQLPAYRLESVFPPGGRPGSTVDVAVLGADLETADGLWFSDPGLTAALIEKGKFKVAVGETVEPGTYDVRVVGPLGISNPRTFLVDDRAQLLEAEPNDRPERANPLAAGLAIDGRIDPPTDVDGFVFDARAGEPIALELTAAGIESPLDPVLRLFDETGRELARGPDPDGDGADRDPRIEWTATTDGRYRVEVTDAVYAGSPNHVYRLTSGVRPRLITARPLAAEPGSHSALAFVGRRLDAASADQAQATVGWPVDPSTGVLPAALSQQAGVPGFPYRHPTPSGPTNPIWIARALGPVGLEAEPNDQAPAAQPLSAPRDLTGSFGKSSDRDLYRLAAKKGQAWIVEIIADRQGSAADPVLRIVKLNADGTQGREVAGGDDSADRDLGSFFSQATLDPSVRWEVGEDADYLIEVQDLYASQRGSERLTYRLVVRPPTPDFRLFVVPYAPDRPAGLTLRAGGRASVRVLVDRLDGFDRPVLVQAVDLPPGVRSDPVTIAGKQSRGVLILEADDGVAPAIADLRILGRAVSEDRREHLATLERAPRLGEETDRPGIPGGLIVSPPQQEQPAPARATRGFPFALRPGAPLRLTAEPAEVTVAPGQSFELKVRAERKNGFDNQVDLTADGLPRNLNPPTATIAKDQAEATLRFDVPNNLAPGVYGIHVRGAGAYPFDPDPKGEAKKDVRIDEPSNSVRLIVRKP